ncbi:polymer-forming cytoskeletal protein [Candidatus Uhrbacteria bacterium]|nr:polymer-forming cytoskeletal protein [Candidatus Uhrbacteria bacterium]
MSKEHLTTIATGVKVEGDFVSEGDVVIEGEVSGTVKTKAHLHVGGGARISADVSAKSAVIAGSVVGNLAVEERLELQEGSSVEGDIRTSILSIAPGARVNGHLAMGPAGGAEREAA